MFIRLSADKDSESGMEMQMRRNVFNLGLGDVGIICLLAKNVFLLRCVFRISVFPCFGNFLNI